MQTVPAPRINRRYEVLETLGKGGMGVVYRARDLLTGRVVALKSVKLSQREHLERDDTAASLPEAENPTTTPSQLHAVLATMQQDVDPDADSHTSMSLRLALTQEFRTLASLRHPNIIHVLDYGFSDGQPYFTMELLEHARPLHEAAAHQPVSTKLELISQLLQALNYLHRHRILHRDLKPTNVLVVDTPGSLGVKVLDFGLALGREEAQRSGSEVSGTLAYIAPEQWLGSKPSEASDLYAVGVIAYLLLTGRHPFEMHDEAQIVMATLRYQPDMTPLAACGQVAAVIARLLAKSPTDRYADAEAVIKALAEASGIPLSQESSAVRDCFLQAARFIGRQEDLNRLRAGLHTAVRGIGSAWLIGGESGVGKSRLLEELRAFALVHGALVARGQAVASSGSAYMLWPDVLRLSCLHNQVSDMEASVIKPLVPDLKGLLGRAVLDAPELDAQAAQMRLVFTAETLITRQTQPLLIILEDLHWVDAESLLLLKRLLLKLNSRPIMVVASFRDDESPQLAAELKDMQQLKLQRLSDAEMAALSESMLGPQGNNPTVVSFITRETEGNVFFAIEVVRALAEEAGQLGSIGQKTISKRVVAGGIKAVIQRRLGRVPEAARPLLRLAAVAGRQLDLTVLSELEPNLQAWLELCADKAVLEVVEERWRFAHDKLRESLLEEMSPQEARSLHQQVAQLIEKAYGAASLNTAALAFHYREAGDLTKAAHYSLQAGEQALSQGALTAAAALLEQALLLQEQAPSSLLAQVRARRLLMCAQFGLGQMKACTQTHEQALSRLGKPLHTSAARRLSAMTVELMLQTLHRFSPRFLRRPADAQQRALHLEHLLLWWRASEAYIMLGKSDLAGYGMLVGLNLSEIVDDRVRQVFLYTLMAYFFGMIPQRRMSRYYLRLAEMSAHAVNEPRSSLEYLRMVGLIDMGEGRFEAAQKELQAARALARQLGDDYLCMFCAACLNFITSLTGAHELQLSLMNEMQTLAQRTQNAQYLAIGQIGQGYEELIKGRFDSCLSHFAVASEHCTRSADVLNKTHLDSYRALCALRMGDAKKAREIADSTLLIVQAAQLTSVGLLPCLAGLLNVYLSLWEDHPEALDSAPVQSVVYTLLSRIDKLARAFPASLAYALLMHGRFAWRMGRLMTALRFLRKSLQRAEALKMLPAQAQAHYFLGRLGKSPLGRIYLGQDGRQHLLAAAELFEKVGDTWAREHALLMDM